MYKASLPTAEGGVARLFADCDWEGSSLGVPDSWPPSLRCVFETMLAAQSQVIIFAGREFVALYNDAYAPTIGRKHPAAFGRPAAEYWTEPWPMLEPMLHKVYREGQTVSARDLAFETDRHGYPETAYFDISYSPIRDETGVVAVLCIVSETTDRIEAQRIAMKGEARLHSIFAQSAAGMALIDMQGRFTMVNGRMSTLLGYEQSEMLGMRYCELVHADDLAEARDHRMPQLEGGGAFEQRLLRKDGTSVWVTTSGAAVSNETGTVDAVSIVVTDIDFRRRAEADERQLAAIIASSNEAILSTDLEMRITSWNGGAEKLYGYVAEEVIGELVTILVPNDRSAEEAAIIDQIRSGHEVLPHETIRKRKDGSLVEVSLAVAPVYDESGQVVGASKIARDISQRKRAERMQSVLVHEMKHRVKNILTTVLAIARQTLGDGLGQAADTFRSRLMALARAQDLVTNEQRDGADLRDIINEVIAPYPAKQFVITGPPILLLPRTALAFALGLHELATNAAKYGALSAEDGVVSIDWQYSEDAGLKFVWREAGGPTVSESGGTGFGSVLIKEVLPAEFMGEVMMEFESTGLICRLTAPAWEDLATV